MVKRNKNRDFTCRG